MTEIAACILITLLNKIPLTLGKIRSKVLTNTWMEIYIYICTHTQKYTHIFISNTNYLLNQTKWRHFLQSIICSRNQTWISLI